MEYSDAASNRLQLGKQSKHKSRLAVFVLDSKVDDIQQASEFWSQAQGDQLLPSDPDWAERYAYLDNPCSEPRLLLQKVEHPSHTRQFWTRPPGSPEKPSFSVVTA